MIEKYPKKAILRDKKEIIIRPLEEGDFRELLHFFQHLPTEDRIYFHSDVTNPKIVKDWCYNIDFSEVFPLIGLYKNKIIADFTLHKNKYGWSPHVGEIRGIVAQGFRKLGIATIMFRDLMDVAITDNLKKIICYAMESQTDAVELLKRFHFKEEANLKDQVVDFYGQLHNLLIMTHFAHDLWEELHQLYDKDLGVMSGIY